MPRPPPRLLGLAVGVALLLLIFFYNTFTPSTLPRLNSNPLSTSVDDLAHISPDTQKGGAIMGHWGNETTKAELGRAAWKLFHTTMARFPNQPSMDESQALKSYIYLFARLYPCGECASHFQKILKKFPPQTSSRTAAASWGCHVHNEVNKSKGKPLFDCSNILDHYGCGCGDEEKEVATKSVAKSEMSDSAKMKMVQDGRDLNLDHFKPVEIAKEGLTNGG
jgi:FAD-linked sulfhydryl oxidase